MCVCVCMDILINYRISMTTYNIRACKYRVKTEEYLNKVTNVCTRDGCMACMEATCMAKRSETCQCVRHFQVLVFCHISQHLEKSLLSTRSFHNYLGVVTKPNPISLSLSFLILSSDSLDDIFWQLLFQIIHFESYNGYLVWAYLSLGTESITMASLIKLGLCFFVLAHAFLLLPNSVLGDSGNNQTIYVYIFALLYPLPLL